MNALSEKVAIVGIGESKVGKVPERSTLQLQSDAAYAALDDAGLTMEDIDGLITTPIRTEPWNMPCGVVASFLGVRPAYLSTLDLAGASGCAKFHFYPRSACPFCGCRDLSWHEVSGKGEVYSYTVVRRAPSKGFAAEVPYVVAVVALDEGPHLMTRLTHIAPDDVRIGLRVVADFRRMDDDTTLPLFRYAG